MKKGFAFWFKRFVYFVGFVTLVIVIGTVGLIGFSKIEYALANPSLNSGIVTSKTYYDGHENSVMWTFGDYTISKKVSGESCYYIGVSDGEHEDFWIVNEDEWINLNVGEFVKR